MKKSYLYLATAVAGLLFIAAVSAPKNNNKAADVKSISALTFGPGGILFIGDSKSATVFAVNTKDTKKGQPAKVDIENIDQKIIDPCEIEPPTI